MRKIIASLDIGTNTIKLVVGEVAKNSLNILCVSEVPTKGIKRGLISNSEEFLPTLKEVFDKAEEMLGVPVKEVVLNIPAYFIESFILEGSSKITNEDHCITEQDIDRAMKSITYNKLPVDSEIVSVIPTRYKVDGEVVKNPLKLEGKNLNIKAVVVIAPKKIIKEFTSVLESAEIKVVDVVASPLADYLTNSNKELNQRVSALINVGEEITTVSVYNKGILMRSEVIELGGTNIDNDIAYIYKITKKDARELKENLGLATTKMADGFEKRVLTDRLGESIVINQSDLSEIIESRLLEILGLAKKQINLLTKKNVEVIMVTGGTSEMRDFNILLDKVFTKPHILGKIDIVGVRNNKYSTAVGIIKYYIGRLKLKNKDYSVFNLEELEILSGMHKKVNINENSILGKLFGYFFDS